MDAAFTEARELDRDDPLAGFRQRFLHHDDDLIYLDGNSLGRLPIETVERVTCLVRDEWGDRLVRGWSEWIHKPKQIASKIAGLIGANEGEVMVCDSTTINLFKLVVAALESRPQRQVVLTDDLNFPSDLYCIQGALRRYPGTRLEIIKSEDRVHLPTEVYRSRLSEDVALLTTSHTSFKSGFLHDMKAVTAAAHDVGALVLWDLGHSVGALPVDLGGSGADLAIGCTYKYLNGGPGSPAFLYVRRDLQEELTSPLWGWFGQKDPFAFSLNYSPADGIQRFTVGTPPMISTAGVEPGVDLVVEAGVQNLRLKSIQQTEFLIRLWRDHLQPLGVSLNSPEDPTVRGSHISFGHPEALRIDKALIEEKNVIPDFRAPDNIRYGVTPLYTSFTDVAEGVKRLRDVILEGAYKKYSTEKPSVT